MRLCGVFLSAAGHDAAVGKILPVIKNIYRIRFRLARVDLAADGTEIAVKICGRADVAGDNAKNAADLLMSA